jgi:hypothetical protein
MLCPWLDGSASMWAGSGRVSMPPSSTINGFWIFGWLTLGSKACLLARTKPNETLLLLQ